MNKFLRQSFCHYILADDCNLTLPTITRKSRSGLSTHFWKDIFGTNVSNTPRQHVCGKWFNPKIRLKTPNSQL